MIAYIKGKITHKSPTMIILEANGIGYQIYISLTTYGYIHDKDVVQLHTHLNIKEDAHTLYGFCDEMEKKIFQQLISVSGVGPSTAQVVLSSLNPQQVISAIQHEDAHTFHRVKGIGPKTAKRIIIDLKDKVQKFATSEVLTSGGIDNTNREEALSALVALGFSRPQATKVINELMRQDAKEWTLEELVKQSLRKLSS